MKIVFAALWLASALFVTAHAARADGPTPLPSPSSTPFVLEEEMDDVDPNPPLRASNVQAFYTNASYGPGNVRVGQVIPRFDVLRIGNSYARISFPRYAWTDGGSYGMSDSAIVYLASLPASTVSRAGVGVTVYIPSASSPNLGLGTWGIGPAVGMVHLNPAKPVATGFLLQSLFSFAGPSTRTRQRVVSFQPLVVVKLGKGWSLRSADAQWGFDFVRGSTLIPVSLGVGKLFTMGTHALNVVLADAVTVVHANAPLAPKNTVKLTIVLMDTRRSFTP